MKRNLRRPRKPRRIKGGAKVRAVCENSEKEEELYALCANGEEPGRKELA
jgi:hypothetical protein